MICWAEVFECVTVTIAMILLFVVTEVILYLSEHPWRSHDRRGQ